MPISHTSLAEAIDIPAWLEKDRQRDWQSKIQRDQQISRHADIAHKDQTERVLHWWSQVHPVIDEDSPGQVLATYFKRVSWIALLLGIIVGIALAASLLHYDGTQPINVLVLLIVLVLIPLLLFLLSLLIPVFNSSSLISGFNVGNQIFALFRRKNPILKGFFSTSRSDRTRDSLLRWKLLLCSQQFGVALAVAALLTLLAKVSFSDLAFGWSTTLDIESSSLTPWIQVITTPWSAWLPEAVPSNQLVEQSRFYRLEDAERALSAQALTAWWKFIAMCLLVYGIGLRLFAVWLASMKYKRATDDMLMQHPEVTALLERFNMPSKFYDVAPVVSEKNDSVKNSDQDFIEFNTQSADIVILWNNVSLLANKMPRNNFIKLTSEDALQLNSNLFKQFDKNSVEKIHIITKAWEPPLLEFHDLIIRLKEMFGSQTIISVQPIATDQHAPKQVDVEIWRHSIEKLKDPKVYVL